MNQEWYFVKDGQKHGPVSESNLRQLIQAGTIKASDMVWRQGTQQWVAAEKAFPQAPEASTPPPVPSQAKSGLLSKVKQRLQSDETKALVEQAKARWRTSTTPIKAAIVGGAAVCFLLICVWPMSWFFGGGSGREVQGNAPSPPAASPKGLVGEWKLDHGSRPGTVRFTEGGTVVYSYIDPGFTSDDGEFFPARKEMKTAKFVFLKQNAIEITERNNVVRFEIEFLANDDIVLSKLGKEYFYPFANIEGRLTRTQVGAAKKTIDGQGNQNNSELTHAIVASKVKRGMTPVQVRNAIGPPEKESKINIPPVIDSETGKPVADPKTGKPIPTGLDQLIWSYQSKDGLIVIVFQSGVATKAGSLKKGDIF